MSQSAQILEYMEKGNSITPQEALYRFNCFRLAARILELKNQGYVIETKTVKNPNFKRYARYRLVK